MYVVVVATRVFLFLLLLDTVSSLYRGMFSSHTSRKSPSTRTAETPHDYSPLATSEDGSKSNAQDMGTDSQQLLRDIGRVAMPSLAASICEPVLSLVDTYCVGHYGSAVVSRNGLAGMMVNTALFNMIAAATVNLMGGSTDVTSKIVGGAKVGVMTQESEVLGTGLWMALFCGIFFSTLVLTCGESVLLATSSMEPAVYEVAMSYMKTRAFALPATMMNFVIIGFSLGVQEMLAPLLLIFTSLLVNVVGDVYLIPRHGLYGAALATVAASYMGMVAGLTRLLSIYNVNFWTLGSRKFAADGGSTERGVVAWFQRLKAQLAPFWSTSGPLFVGKLTDALTYSSGAFVTAACNPKILTQVSAAHQIVLQTWWFLSFCPTSLAMTAQSYLPKDLASSNLRHGRALIFMLLKLGFALSVCQGCIQWILPHCFPTLFTDSLEIQNLVMSVVMQSSLSQFVLDLATSMDGMFIGSGRLRYYMFTCAVSTLSAWTWFYYSIANNAGLTGYWNGVLLFSCVRLTCYLSGLPSILRDMFPADTKEDVRDTAFSVL